LSIAAHALWSIVDQTPRQYAAVEIFLPAERQYARRFAARNAG